MSSGRKYSAEQVRECLAVLDAAASSGMTLQAYAQARGMEYWQLRGWAAQAPRWRAQLAGGDADAAGQPVKFVEAAMPVAMHAGGAHARIVCEVGSRRVQVEWPVAAATECALWLRAWLG